MKHLRILVICSLAVVGIGLTTYFVAANNQHAHKSASLQKSGDTGPLSNATVSFGAWKPPLDRFLNVPPPPPANEHVVAPQIAKIKAGGAVNFIIAGLHNVVVYEDGTRPEDIDVTLIANPPAPPAPQVPVIDDPNGRIYRGPDPRRLFPNVDRVEVVYFAEPGTYLVICGVLPHFQGGMYGYVRVVP